MPPRLKQKTNVDSVKERRLGLFVIGAGFLSGVLKSAKWLPDGARPVELVQLNDDRVGFVFALPDLPPLKKGGAIPQVLLNSEGTPKIIKDAPVMATAATDNKEPSVEVKKVAFPWET